MQKKDSEGVVYCPKCDSKNHSSQKRCGKCGYIFPHKEKKSKKDEKRSSFANEMQSSQEPQEQLSEQDLEEEQKEQESVVAKLLSEKVWREGHLRSIGMKTICSRCGAQNSVHVRRCVRCGNKFTKKK